MGHSLLHIAHHTGFHICSFLRLSGFWLHPNCGNHLYLGLFGHNQSEFRICVLFRSRLLIYHTEVRTFRHGDGHRASWGKVGLHQEEGRLEMCKTEKQSNTTTKHRAVFTLLFSGHTVYNILTVAACGSSPHAQCMVGFWPSASEDLVISSESLLGEVGREFPGLARKTEQIRISVSSEAEHTGFHHTNRRITSVEGSTRHLNACEFRSAGTSCWLSHLLRGPEMKF